MECKFVPLVARRICAIELIDTLWNVNEDEKAFGMRINRELIDTLWNVNLSKNIYNFQGSMN